MKKGRVGGPFWVLLPYFYFIKLAKIKCKGSENFSRP